MTEAKPCLPGCYRAFADNEWHHMDACPNAAPKASEAEARGACMEWDPSCDDCLRASPPPEEPAPAPEPTCDYCHHPVKVHFSKGCGSCLDLTFPRCTRTFAAPEPKQGSACCEECKRYHRHIRTDCCKCRTSFGPSDIPEPEPKQGSKEPQKIRCNLITDPTLKSCEETILALRDDIQTLQGSLAYWRDNRLPAVEAERDALRAEVEESKKVLAAHQSEANELRAELAASDEDLKTMLQAAGEEAERQLATAREEISKLRKFVSKAMHEADAEKASADRAERENEELAVSYNELKAKYNRAEERVKELEDMMVTSITPCEGACVDEDCDMVRAILAASAHKEGESR